MGTGSPTSPPASQMVASRAGLGSTPSEAAPGTTLWRQGGSAGRYMLIRKLPRGIQRDIPTLRGQHRMNLEVCPGEINWELQSHVLGAHGSPGSHQWFWQFLDQRASPEPALVSHHLASTRTAPLPSRPLSPPGWVSRAVPGASSPRQGSSWKTFCLNSRTVCVCGKASHSAPGSQVPLSARSPALQMRGICSGPGSCRHGGG